MRNLILLFCFVGIPFGLIAQWNAYGTDIYNTNGGFVGVGITVPAVKLHVETPQSDSEKTLLKIGHRSASKEVGAIIEIGTSGYRTGGTARIVGYSNPHSVAYSKLALQTWNGSIWNKNTITNMGSNNLLAVNGTAVFVKAKVALYGSSWPDYVFTPTYKVPQLDSLQQFIKLNGHLPEMPNAEEVAKNGLDLGNTGFTA